MAGLVLLFIFVVFAVALTPQFNDALNVARSSWPAGTFMLDLIPSPLEFAFLVLVTALILLAAYVATQLTQ